MQLLPMLMGWQVRLSEPATPVDTGNDFKVCLHHGHLE